MAIKIIKQKLVVTFLGTPTPVIGVSPAKETWNNGHGKQSSSEEEETEKTTSKYDKYNLHSNQNRAKPSVPMSSTPSIVTDNWITVPETQHYEGANAQELQKIQHNRTWSQTYSVNKSPMTTTTPYYNNWKTEVSLQEKERLGVTVIPFSTSKKVNEKSKIEEQQKNLTKSSTLPSYDYRWSTEARTESKKTPEGVTMNYPSAPTRWYVITGSRKEGKDRVGTSTSSSLSERWYSRTGEEQKQKSREGQSPAEINSSSNPYRWYATAEQNNSQLKTSTPPSVYNQWTAKLPGEQKSDRLETTAASSSTSDRSYSTGEDEHDSEEEEVKLLNEPTTSTSIYSRWNTGTTSGDRWYSRGGGEEEEEEERLGKVRTGNSPSSYTYDQWKTKTKPGWPQKGGMIATAHPSTSDRWHSRTGGKGGENGGTETSTFSSIYDQHTVAKQEETGKSWGATTPPSPLFDKWHSGTGQSVKDNDAEQATTYSPTYDRWATDKAQEGERGRIPTTTSSSVYKQWHITKEPQEENSQEKPSSAPSVYDEWNTKTESLGRGRGNSMITTSSPGSGTWYFKAGEERKSNSETELLDKGVRPGGQQKHISVAPTHSTIPSRWYVVTGSQEQQKNQEAITTSSAPERWYARTGLEQEKSQAETTTSSSLYNQWGSRAESEEKERSGMLTTTSSLISGAWYSKIGEGDEIKSGTSLSSAETRPGSQQKPELVTANHSSPPSRWYVMIGSQEQQKIAVTTSPTAELPSVHDLWSKKTSSKEEQTSYVAPTTSSSIPEFRYSKEEAERPQKESVAATTYPPMYQWEAGTPQEQSEKKLESPTASSYVYDRWNNRVWKEKNKEPDATTTSAYSKFY